MSSCTEKAMDKELKAKWVAALRSGEYKQGIGQMRPPPDKYCCLAVLHAVADIEDVFKVVGHDKAGTLVHMNDGLSDDRRFHSFDEIADWIEANL